MEDLNSRRRLELIFIALLPGVLGFVISVVISRLELGYAWTEAGNILNHGVYNNPQGSLTSATFGQITSVRDNYPERQIRFGMRLTF